MSSLEHYSAHREASRSLEERAPLDASPPARARSYVETLLERILKAVSSAPPDSSGFKRDGSATLDGSGNATITLATPPQGQRLRVKHLSITTAGNPTIRLYLDGVAPQNLVAIEQGAENVLQDTPGVPVPPATNLVVRISGGTVGAAAVAVAWGEIEHDPGVGG